MRPLLRFLAGCLLALLPCAALAQTGGPSNAITRSLLQNGVFDLLGTYRFAGGFYPPAVFVDPPGCVVPPSGSVRMIINLTENVQKICSAPGVWTTIGSASLPSPYNLNQVFSGTVGFTGTTNFSGTGTHAGAETFSNAATFNGAATFGSTAQFNGEITATNLATFAGAITVTNSATFTGTTDIKRQNTIEVCKSGCTYSTVSAGVQAAASATSTNRYEVRVGCGDYDETVNLVANGSTPINYITIRGVDRNCVRIRGAATTGTIRTQSKDVTGIVLDNITVGGSIPVLLNGTFGTGATRTTFKMTNVILGIIDGSENAAAGKSIDGFVSSNTAKNRDIYLSNSICYSTFDCVRPMLDETLYAYSNLYIIDDLGTQTLRAEPYSLSQGGAQIYDIGSTTFLRRSVDSAGAGVGGYGAVMGPTTAGGTRPTVINLQSVKIYISTYGAATNAKTLACLYLDTTPALLAGSYVLFKDVDCRVEDSSNTWHVRGIGGSGNDADYANLTVRWEGGTILRSGGVDSNDVDDQITQAGFGIVFSGVRNAGSYTGAGIANFTTGDQQMGRFGTNLYGPTIAGSAVTVSGEISYDTTANDLEYGDNGTNRKVANLDEAQTFTNKTLTAPVIATISNTGTLTLPTSTDTLVGKATSDILTNKTLTAPLITLADLVVGTCTAGQVGIDNGGATKELCICGTANTWGCWKLTDGTFNANGPAD